MTTVQSRWLPLLCLLLPILFQGCKKCDLEGDDYKGEMRDFVISISEYGRSVNPNFIVIPQNGENLLTDAGSSISMATDPIAQAYVDAIDGQAREDLRYGFLQDDERTPDSEFQDLYNYLVRGRDNGLSILVTDYCWTTAHVDASYQENSVDNFISFAAPDRELNNLPNYPDALVGENANDVLTLADANNFLYLLNTGGYSSRQAFIDAIQATNYDLLITDLFFNDGTSFTTSEVEALHLKANGSRRLVVSYMSIGEAEDYRYYWESDWKRKGKRPDWIEKENKAWEGNFKVCYWEPEWQSIITGNADSYTQKVIDAGFDGVYLDIIDAFEYFEQ